MDIRMPVRDGLSAATEILAAAVRPRVIMLTTFLMPTEMVHRALRAGADGFLLKDTAGADRRVDPCGEPW